jgi:hypothetical protein
MLTFMGYESTFRWAEPEFGALSPGGERPRPEAGTSAAVFRGIDSALDRSKTAFNPAPQASSGLEEEALFVFEVNLSR